MSIARLGSVIESSPAAPAPAPPGTRNLGVDPIRLMLLPRFAAIDLAYALLFGIALRSLAVALEALPAGGFVMPGLVLFDGELAPGAWVWLIAVPILVSPLVEELVFRGVLQPLATRGFASAGMPRGIATGIAVVIVAAAFGAGHVLLNPGPWPLVTGLTTFFVGLVCGALAAFTGRLGPAIGVHLVFNVTGVAMLLIGTFA